MPPAEPTAPDWWDAVVPVAIPISAEDDPRREARDHLALAAVVHERAGGAAEIAQLLQGWSVRLHQPDPGTPAQVLAALDRLDRTTCEPQAWHHLTRAEQALARLARGASVR